MAEIAGHPTLDTPYVWPAPSSDVVAAFRLTAGEARAHLPQNGPATLWTFFDGSAKPGEAPWKLEMNAADTVVCQVQRATSITIIAQPRGSAGAPLQIGFIMGARILLTLIHACQPGACDETSGKEFPRFYQMLERHHRTPQATAEPLTDTGWCPPGLFWS
jgi:hypothetical protein